MSAPARHAATISVGVVAPGNTGTLYVRHDSIVGSSFTARVAGQRPEGVICEVDGTAYRTGEHRFVLDPRDDLGTGFVLR